MSTKHILIVGRSPAVLESTAALLKNLSYDVETTDNFDNVAAMFDLGRFDLITTGNQVPVEKRAEIRRDATALKSDMLFVQGLAGIPGLLVEQIEGEFAAQKRNAQQAPVYDQAANTVKLSLQQPGHVVATAWWQTTFVPPNPGSDSRVLCNDTLPTGEHAIAVPADIPAQAAFISVRINDAIYCFKLIV